MSKKKKTKGKKPESEKKSKTPSEVKAPTPSSGSDAHTGEEVRDLFGTCDPEDKHFRD